MSYQNGFEDATELCLKELQQAKSKVDAQKRLQHLLGLVKENKFDRLKQMLGVLL